MTKHLLVVEDDDGHAALIQAVLSGEPGLSVEVVASGRAAMERLSGDAAAPDAVLLDVDLPDLSGLEVLRELARQGVTGRIPVVVYTASCDPTRRNRALGLGAAAFVEKPTDFSELVPLLRKHLGRQRRRWFG